MMNERLQVQNWEATHKEREAKSVECRMGGTVAQGEAAHQERVARGPEWEAIGAQTEAIHHEWEAANTDAA